ncbi:Arylsulphatase [Penicillium lagena]|uniref:Arylsulphatase n=1 Tax=Penicillium lagena TaxID=94218 RepID=UPI002541B193|nr:Arylsulphatase [Penicillium lagena]KAJ5606445.1 Arylsulphatase [Penicillium lagena]
MYFERNGNSPGTFTGSDFLVYPYPYEYYNSSMFRNGAASVSYEGQYFLDIVAQKAYDCLDKAIIHKLLWFLTVAPIAPLSTISRP